MLEQDGRNLAGYILMMRKIGIILPIRGFVSYDTDKMALESNMIMINVGLINIIENMCEPIFTQQLVQREVWVGKRVMHILGG